MPFSPPEPRKHLDSATRKAIAALSVTQIVGWGTTYFSPAVLAPAMMRDLGMTREEVFAGVAVMLLVAGLVAPFAGRALDRFGGRPVMALGSVVATLATALLAIAQGRIGYYAAWMCIGAVLPLALGAAGFTAVAQVAGDQARRAIVTLTLLSGLSSTVFWPVAGLLEAQFGWRTTYLMFASLNLLVCLPLHLVGLPRARTRGMLVKSTGTDGGELPSSRRLLGFVLLAIASSAQGFVGWGLSLHLPALLEGFGVAAGTALVLAALNGPGQVGARSIDLLTGGKVHPLRMGLGALGAMPAAFAVLFLAGATVPGAALFVLVYAGANGLMTVARATMPLALFGHAGYGALLGKLTLPQNLVFAAAPVVFAAVLNRGGPLAAAVVASAVSLVGFGALFALSRLAGLDQRAR